MNKCYTQKRYSTWYGAARSLPKNLNSSLGPPHFSVGDRVIQKRPVCGERLTGTIISVVYPPLVLDGAQLLVAGYEVQWDNGDHCASVREPYLTKINSSD